MTPTRRARYWHEADDGKLRCDLCPRGCRLGDGQRGACVNRERQGNELVLTTYGRSSGLALDPIEKKPLYHFHPGSSVLSFGTMGCNLTCNFCQNWHITRSRDTSTVAVPASPEDVARTAVRHGCRSVAFTYNDPVVFAEYAMDVADACHELGVLTVAVTAGYICGEARRDLFEKMDAVNVDLKAFSEDFYARQTGSALAPIKETLLHLVHHTSAWTEVTTLLIPGLNDSEREVSDLSAWIAEELGPEVPLHLSAFHPAHHMTRVPPTPPETLRAARDVARRQGLRHVYTGNVRDPEGSTTLCPSCKATLIVREGFGVVGRALDGSLCKNCRAPLAGRFGDHTKS